MDETGGEEIKMKYKGVYSLEEEDDELTLCLISEESHFRPVECYRYDGRHNGETCMSTCSAFELVKLESKVILWCIGRTISIKKEVEKLI